MKICKKCEKPFKTKMRVDGKIRVFSTRKFCLTCSPFGQRNTRDLTVSNDAEDKRRRRNKKNRKWQRKVLVERKLKLVALLGGKCNKCGYNKCLKCLHFHHRDPSEKKFGFSAVQYRLAWDVLVDEAKKCDLLCPTCHCETHEELRC